MADVIGPRITGMQHDVDEIKRHMESIGNRNSGNSHVRIDAGGMGVWIATTACIAMLCAGLIGALWISRELSRIDARMAEQEVKIDRANTFLSAIWANAPELEKKIKDEQEKETSRAE